MEFGLSDPTQAWCISGGDGLMRQTFHGDAWTVQSVFWLAALTGLILLLSSLRRPAQAERRRTATLPTPIKFDFRSASAGCARRKATSQSRSIRISRLIFWMDPTNWRDSLLPLRHAGFLRGRALSRPEQQWS